MYCRIVLFALVLMVSHVNADRMSTVRRLQQQASAPAPQVSQRPVTSVIPPQQLAGTAQRPAVTPQQLPAAGIQQPAPTIVMQQQTPVVLVPAAAAVCTTLQDARMPQGSLCVSQALTTTTSSVVCDSYDKSCITATSKTAVVTPAGDAYSNPQGFQASADAACKVLGYAAAGSGSIHMSGSNAKKNCWNGQKWATDNYWVSLVCCK